MEVTKSNFKDILPIFKEAVEECNFLAIDTELTGLKTDMRKEHAFDTMEERYQKALEISKDFLIIQFGVSCFKFHADTNKYTHKDFNFYVFPRPSGRHAPDTIFMCQPSSILYLTKYGFDFGKLIYEGISYIMPHDEERLRSILKAKHEEENVQNTPDKNSASNEQKDVRVPDEHKNFIKLIHQKINSFLKDDTETKLHLPPCTGFQRKLIYQSVDKNNLGVGLTTCVNDSKQSYILIEKMSDEEKLKKLHLKQLADLDELDDSVGFRRVIDIISSSQKLVIGHNMFLDILHTVHQFLHPLPNNLKEFKDLIKSMFPRLLDTKTLASSPQFKDVIIATSLSEILLELKRDKYIGTIEAAEDFNYYDVELDKMHEAGFDAFVTGYCFIKLALILKNQSGDKQGLISIESPFLRPYRNRPYVMRHYDIQSLNLRGPDPEATRENVFYISFPKEWRTVDLVELFSPYGNIYVCWLSDTSALVGLKSPEQSVNVKRVLLKELSKRYTVKPYAEYKAQLSNRPSSNSCASREEPSTNKRRKLSSSILDTNLTNRSITPIPEDDENEDSAVDKQDDCVSTSLDDSTKSKSVSAETPKAKKQKIVHEENETNEVSSTEKLFEEPAVW